MRRKGLYEMRTAAAANLFGNFVELVDTTVHPLDCTCVQCVPQPPKVRQPYDSLYLKQKYSQEF